MKDDGSELREAWSSAEFVAFMQRATLEIRRVFGPEVRYELDLFRDPEDLAKWALHVTIDSTSPAEACERLDKLCDEWWDEVEVVDVAAHLADWEACERHQTDVDTSIVVAVDQHEVAEAMGADPRHDVVVEHREARSALGFDDGACTNTTRRDDRHCPLIPVVLPE